MYGEGIFDEIALFCPGILINNPITHVYGTVCQSGQFFIVRDNHKSLSKLLAQVKEKLVQLLLVLRIEASRRFVRHHY